MSKIFSGLDVLEDAPVVTRERHARALRLALGEIESFRSLVEDGGPAEIAGIHLADATALLDGLIGRVDQEDILDAVFSSFCVGK